MAEDDEIDIIGDFSFNSCFAQNNQGIPSCSDREDTVHPQWLLDSTANNWYDVDDKKRNRKHDGPSRKLSGNNSNKKHENCILTIWSDAERDILKKAMVKYGRNVDKISQTLKSKNKIEIQALIEAEYGITLDPPGMSADDIDNIPPVVHEEIVLDTETPIVNINDVMNMVTTGVPTIPIVEKPLKKHIKKLPKLSKSKTKNNVVLHNMVNPSEIIFEDDLTVASMELVLPENVNITKKISTKQKGKSVKKMGNHRRKGLINDKVKFKWKNKVKHNTPPKTQGKDSSLSDDSTKNPKMHIVLGSGQALPVSEGEEIIKIEKKKESEGESDIEVDVDSDREDDTTVRTVAEQKETEPNVDNKVAKIRKFEPMPKRNKKINLDGGGGYTIMHTETGDVYEMGEEPRRQRPARSPPARLYPCRVYGADAPAPFVVRMFVSCLIAMDAHAHTSRGEVAGLVGGDWCAPLLTLRQYRPVRAASRRTHCDMDPVSQARAAERLRAGGACVLGWHHSHPSFPAAPSELDLRSQAALQSLPATAPALALITSQHWPRGRTASQYRCLRVEETDEETGLPVGYQLSVQLIPDLTADTLAPFVRELRALPDGRGDELSVRVRTDVCPQAGLTYLEKLISSVRHHMRSAGHADSDPLVEQLSQAVRDVFR